MNHASVQSARATFSTWCVATGVFGDSSTLQPPVRKGMQAILTRFYLGIPEYLNTLCVGKG